MKSEEFNTILEELMVKFDIRKQKYVTPSGLVEGRNESRYWRLDGISEGLQMAWHVFNETKNQKDIIGEQDER